MAEWAPDGRNLAVIRGKAALQWMKYPIGKKIAQGSGSILSLSLSPRETGSGYRPQALWKVPAPSYRAGLWEIQPVRVASDCETFGCSRQYLPETVYVVLGLAIAVIRARFGWRFCQNHRLYIRHVTEWEPGEVRRTRRGFEAM